MNAKLSELQSGLDQTMTDMKSGISDSIAKMGAKIEHSQPKPTAAAPAPKPAPKPRPQ
jgi:hypothetical protein